MELQVGVKAALRNKDGRFLLVRRSPTKYPEAANRWDIVGGRIEPGSPLIDNLKREIKEEVGLDLMKEPVLIAAQDILIPQFPDRHVVRLTFVGEIDGAPQLDSDHTEFGWFTLSEMKNLEGLDIFFRELLKNGTVR